MNVSATPNAHNQAMPNIPSISDSQSSVSTTGSTKSFHEVLSTPKLSKRTAPRREAINAKAKVISKCLFKEVNKGSDKNAKTSKQHKKQSTKLRNKKPSPEEVNRTESLPGPSGAQKQKTTKESWYCKVCQEDRVLDMRLCATCKEYVHEQCVGLCYKDTELFECPDCQDDI